MASYRLGLSAAERDDLTAYVEAVGAVDRARDERPPARRKNETFAYLALVDDHGDTAIAGAAIAAVLAELEGEPPALTPRVRALRARLVKLREQATRREVGVQQEALALRGDLARVAADWAGALASEK